MPIPFNNIPANLRVPGFYAEVNNQLANSAVAAQRSLIIGQMTSGGTGVANVPQQCLGDNDANAVGGQGSMLALMAQAYIDNDPLGEVWYLPLSDAGGATAAAGSVNFTAPPTAAGTIYLYIAGIRVVVPVTASMTDAQIATAVVAAITATPNMPVTAAVDGTVTTKVDLVARNAGLCGNDIDIRMNYLGTRGGEATPTGLTYTITAMTGGATNPTLTTALANLGSKTFDFIAMPYTDTASLQAIQQFLSDSTGRWDWAQQLYGGWFGAYRGNAAALQTFGNTLNDQHGSVMGFYDSPTPNWVIAAIYTAAAAASLRNDAAQPLHTLPLVGFQAPPIQSQFNIGAQNTLLFNGISTFTVGDDGTVRIGGSITTYQKNAAGQADNSYLQVNTLYNLAYVLRQLQGMVTSKYGRCKLAANGTRFAAGSNIVTPSTIKADLIAKYRELEYAGFVQDSDAFAAGLIVQQNATNPNRVDVLFDGILIDQLDIMGLLFQFRNAA